MKKRNVKGQSEIIVTILLILLVLAAIIIVWQVINKSVKSGTNQIDVNAFSYGAELSYAAAGANLNANVKRAAGGGDITGVKIVIDTNSGSYVYTDTTNLPKPLETKTYTITPASAGATNFNNLNKVSVYFTYLQNGEAKTSSLLDSKETAGAITPPAGCTNDAGCTAVGSFCSGTTPYTCTSGTDGCLNRLDGTACSGATPTCNAGTCVGSGSNLVTNGNFTTDISGWTTTTNAWMYGSANARNKGSDFGGDGNLEQNIGAIAGSIYQLTYTIVSPDTTFSGATLTPEIGGVSGIARTGTTSGTFTESITATGTGNLKFKVTGSTTNTRIVIDTVSVVKL